VACSIISLSPGQWACQAPQTRLLLRYASVFLSCSSCSVLCRAWLSASMQRRQGVMCSRGFALAVLLGLHHMQRMVNG